MFAGRKTQQVPILRDQSLSWLTIHTRSVPLIKDEHLDGISFDDTSYLMPWALYTIAPESILNGNMKGELTEGGRRLVKKSLISLLP